MSASNIFPIHLDQDTACSLIKKHSPEYPSIANDIAIYQHRGWGFDVDYHATVKSPTDVDLWMYINRDDGFCLRSGSSKITSVTLSVEEMEPIILRHMYRRAKEDFERIEEEELNMKIKEHADKMYGGDFFQVVRDMMTSAEKTTR